MRKSSRVVCVNCAVGQCQLHMGVSDVLSSPRVIFFGLLFCVLRITMEGGILCPLLNRPVTLLSIKFAHAWAHGVSRPHDWWDEFKSGLVHVPRADSKDGGGLGLHCRRVHILRWVVCSALLHVSSLRVFHTRPFCSVCT